MRISALSMFRGLRRGLNVIGAASLGLVALVVVSELWRPRGCSSRRSEAGYDTIKLEAAVEQYQLVHGLCPRDVAALVAARVVARPWSDPWGRAYDITCAAGDGPVRVCSRGADADDPADDVCSGAARDVLKDR